MKACIKKIQFLFIYIAITFIVTSCGKQEVSSVLSNGEYKANLTMEGGTGKAYIESPVSIKAENGKVTATLVWSSKNYDYMIVNDVKYLNENDGGKSTFTIPIDNIDEPLTVIADTVAMSTPHEIEYTLYFEISND